MKVPKIKGKGLKFMKLLHLLGVTVWMGSCIAVIVLLQQVNQVTDTAGVFYLLEAMELLDWNVIIVGALFTVHLGIVYGFFTNWGFAKFRWLILKWIFSIIIIATGTAFYIPGLDKMRALLTAQGMAALQTTTFQVCLQQQYLLITFHLVLMLLMVILSVFKPHARKNEKGK